MPTASTSPRMPSSFGKKPRFSSGIAIGLNIINTAFFSPSLLLAEGMNQVDGQAAGELYWFYVGFHLVILVIGGALAYFKKA